MISARVPEISTYTIPTKNKELDNSSWTESGGKGFAPGCLGK
jgi:hypothetical protein